MTTNAQTMRWGIEIETHIPLTSPIQPAGYHSGRGRVAGMPDGWRAETDISIGTSLRNRKGAEFVSPILSGDAGIESLCKAVEFMKNAGAQVNASCGVHITVEFPARDAAALARLVSLVARYEDGIFASTGSKARKRNTYCKPVKVYGDLAGGKTADKIKAAIERARQDRRHILNLSHIAIGRNRVEFRCFTGSLNIKKLVGWVRLALGMVELALRTTRVSKWELTSNVRGAGLGEGGKALRALTDKLGWSSKGWAPKGRRWGDIGDNAEGAPSLKAIKKEFRRLAAKYDSEL